MYFRPRSILAAGAIALAGTALALADGADSTRAPAKTPGAGHSWLETTHITPPPQPPLGLIGDAGPGAVRDAFRGGDGTTRVVLLMSPT